MPTETLEHLGDGVSRGLLCARQLSEDLRLGRARHVTPQSWPSWVINFNRAASVQPGVLFCTSVSPACLLGPDLLPVLMGSSWPILSTMVSVLACAWP